MDTQHTPELVINADLLDYHDQHCQYEFVLDESMTVVDCGQVKSLSKGVIHRILRPEVELYGYLFEFNHVRVNPELDNQVILTRFTHAVESSGAQVLEAPDDQMMSVCYKPMGELSDVVRFYINGDGHLTFLSTAVQLRRVV